LAAGALHSARLDSAVRLSELVHGHFLAARTDAAAFAEKRSRRSRSPPRTTAIRARFRELCALWRPRLSTGRLRRADRGRAGSVREAQKQACFAGFSLISKRAG